MSSPMSVVSSPTPVYRSPVVAEGAKETPLSKCSGFTPKCYTPSPLGNNNYLMRSLLPSPYGKVASTSALSSSSTTTSATRSILLQTPQSINKQLSWHQHSTPQSQVKNPFEIALVSQLGSSLVSPGIFALSAPNSDEKKFDWTIDQLAVLHPVDMEDKHSQYISAFSRSVETKAQKDIDHYFSTHVVVPSPFDEIDRNEKPGMSCETSKTKKSTDACCQTNLTLPPNFNLENILGDYMTYQEKKLDTEVVCQDFFSTSSLRRKLFFQGFQESDSSSVGSNRGSFRSDESASETDEPAPIPCTPDWDKQYSTNPLSSSPVSRRSRRYKSYLSSDSFGCGASMSPDISPIRHATSPLSTRSQRAFRRHSIGSLEDSCRRLFSPCESPITCGGNPLEITSLNITDDCSMKTPISSPRDSRTPATKTPNFMDAICSQEMSPLLSSVQKELQLVDPSITWDSKVLKEPLGTLTGANKGCIRQISDPSGGRHGFLPCPLTSEVAAATKNPNMFPQYTSCFPSCPRALSPSQVNDNNTFGNCSQSDTHEMPSALSSSNDISMVPSKFEMTSVDSIQGGSMSQQDTGYMSYNVSSMPSRSEISQSSRSAFLMYTSSSQDVLDSLMETGTKVACDRPHQWTPERQGASQLFTDKLQPAVSEDSLLDYQEVVDHAHQVLTLTSKLCRPHLDQQLPQTLHKENDNTEHFQWQPIGASTPTHKTYYKPASETAAEILQKARDDLTNAL